MDTPFPYSQHVTGKHFVGRKKDVTLLGNLIAQGEHVVIYEPPKTGKTSLVQQTLLDMKMSGKNFVVGQMSVLDIRTVQDFVLRYGSTVLKMAGGNPGEYAALVQEYLDGTHFVFDVEAYSERGEVLSLSWEMDEEDIQAALSLPARISAKKDIMFVLILDNFQCVTLMDNPDNLLLPLSKVLKENLRGRFTAIIMGNGVNAMKSMFYRNIRFHRVVERVALSPIDEKELADHIAQGFRMSGKVIQPADLFLGASRLFKAHPWYTNNFAAICDHLSKGYIPEPVLVDALACILSLHEQRFKDTLDSLTTHQVNLLKAALDGETRFASADIIRKYDLHSSANVKRIKDALMKKEVLVFDDEDNPSFEDPLFEYWLRQLLRG